MTDQPLTLVEFGDEFDRLCQARCKVFEPGIVLSTLKIWFGQIHLFPAPIVRASIERLIRSADPYFPTAGQLRTLCLEAEREALVLRRPTKPADPEPPCLDPPAEWQRVKDDLRRAYALARQNPDDPEMA